MNYASANAYPPPNLVPSYMPMVGSSGMSRGYMQSPQYTQAQHAQYPLIPLPLFLMSSSPSIFFSSLIYPIHISMYHFDETVDIRRQVKYKDNMHPSLNSTPTLLRTVACTLSLLHGTREEACSPCP